MRVALVYDALYPEVKGGVERRVWELARRLRSMSHDVDLLVPQFWDGPSVIVREGITIRGVSPGAPLYRPSGRRALRPSLRHAVGVYRTLLREDYDIVDCQIPAHPAAIAAAIAGRRHSGRGLVITWHEAWGRHWLDEFGVLGYVGRMVEKLVSKLNAAHVAVSNEVSAALRGIGAASDEIIEGGIDIQRVDRAERVGATDVIFIGRLVPSKGVDLLLEAVGRLKREGILRQVVVVGDGPQRLRLERLARQLDLASIVMFKGAIPDWDQVIGTLKGSKMLVLPSRREGFGLTVLEASAAHVPVVTVDAHKNAASNLVVSGRNGLVVDPTPAALATGMRDILENHELRSRMGSHGRQLALSFDWSKTAMKTSHLYEHLFHAQRPQAGPTVRKADSSQSPTGSIASG